MEKNKTGKDRSVAGAGQLGCRCVTTYRWPDKDLKKTREGALTIQRG